MISWISIPFYLWKNTSRRWFEYPVSPLSKILIPTLLGFLSVLVLGLFAGVENELRDQLSKSSVFTVWSSEFVHGDTAATLLARTYEEELIWKDQFPEATFFQVRQPLLSATARGNSLPVLAFTASLVGFDKDRAVDAPPGMFLLVRDPVRWGQKEEITYGSLRVLAEVRKSPDWVTTDLAMEDAVAVQVELVEGILLKGFINHNVAKMESIDQLRNYVAATRAYYRAENRQVKIVSAIGILEELERIQQIQRIIKSLIVIGCSVILALTLGSIAWLEYRQDAYLLALLKSFGTPGFVLLIHMFLENLALVLTGILIVWFSWGNLYSWMLPKLQAAGMRSENLPALVAEDFWVLVCAGVAGVFLAMIPVAIGLRKQPGLILQ